VQSSGREEIDRIASDWWLRKDAGLSAAEERDLKKWRAADPRHEDAWTECSKTWAVFDRAGQCGALSQVVTQLEVRARRRRRVASRASAVGAFLLVSLCVVVTWRVTRSRTDSKPVLAHSLPWDPVRKLPDGSIVELNTGAEIAVRFEAGLRRVELLRGEAHFRVMKDAARPFVVAVSGVEVRAVGTAFSVDFQSSAVDVIVTEGRIAVSRVAPPSAAREEERPGLTDTLVDAGSYVSVSIEAASGASALRVAAISDREIDERLAWRKPKIEFSEHDLSQAVEVINQHNRLQIVVPEIAVRRLRISGTFRADNPEGFVRIVAETFGLRSERRGESEIVLLSGKP
jgi:transmembrane sensor